jgi:hypothetical protein
MSSPIDRETRLNSLRLKLGRELEEDFRKAGSDLMDRLIHDFEREILLAEVFASREDPMKTVIGSICKYKNSSFPKVNW